MLEHTPSIRGHLESTFPGSQVPLLTPNPRWFACSGPRAHLEDQGFEATSQHRPHGRWRGAREVSVLVGKGLGAKACVGRTQVSPEPRPSWPRCPGSDPLHRPPCGPGSLPQVTTSGREAFALKGHPAGPHWHTEARAGSSCSEGVLGMDPAHLHAGWGDGLTAAQWSTGHPVLGHPQERGAGTGVCHRGPWGRPWVS